MATALQAFTNHEFGTIRTITSGGQILFCGRDVAAALGYANTKDALARHCKGVVNHYPLETAGGIQQVRFISEGDLYRLIVSSNLLAAEQALLEAAPKVSYYDVVLASPSLITTLDIEIPKKNIEGYPDPTCYKALKEIQRAKYGYRPLVYICSPYSGDVEANVELARRFNAFTVSARQIPLALHFHYPQFMFKAAIRRICDERQILGVVYKFGQRKLERMVDKLAFSPSITVIYVERLKVAGNHKAWLFTASPFSYPRPVQHSTKSRIFLLSAIVKGPPRWCTPKYPPGLRIHKNRSG